MNILQYLLVDERAEVMPEYALLLALIAIVTVVSITALRTSIIGTFDSSSSSMDQDMPINRVLLDEHRVS